MPWHGWEYDVSTGQSWFAPTEQRVRSYEVTIEQGDSLLDDPDTPCARLEERAIRGRDVPVSIDRKYIVITIST